MNQNRRGFLKWLGIGAGAAVAAPLLAKLPVSETKYRMEHKAIIMNKGWYSDNVYGYKPGGFKMGEVRGNEISSS